MNWCINMYEDKYKNPFNTNLKDLEIFLQLIADLNEEIELFAIGGTAMVLKNIKESTKDIDFLTTIDYNNIKKLFELAGLKETDPSKLCNKWYLNNKIRIDLFYEGYIMGIALPGNWKSLSTSIRVIGKLKLSILDWYDIIITKVARSETRDITDVLDIMKSEKINFKLLKKRYYKVTEDSIVRDYDENFKNIERKLKQQK
jgi:hypothetical protein